MVVVKLSPAQQTTLRQISLQPGPQREAIWHWSTLYALYRRGLVAFTVDGHPLNPSFLDSMSRRRYRVEVTDAGRDEASRLRAAQGVS